MTLQSMVASSCCKPQAQPRAPPLQRGVRACAGAAAEEHALALLAHQPHHVLLCARPARSALVEQEALACRARGLSARSRRRHRARPRSSLASERPAGNAA